MGGEWDHEVDFLVAGAGPGGMAAGLAAAMQGLDVLICEKSQQVGGTGATSAGTLWIPGNSANREAGFRDSVDDARRYLDALTGDSGGDARREIYLAEGARIIDELVANTELEFTACGRHPDYRQNLPGAAVAGRAIIPAPFDGRRLGRDFRRIRPPIPEYLLLGGMMAGKADIALLLKRFSSLRGFIHSASLVARYALDRLRYPRGTRLVMGNALIGQLYLSLKKRDLAMEFGAVLVDLVVEDGRVTGAVIDGPKERRRIRANRGVMLATGGIAHNRKLRERFMPEPVPERSMAVAENTGDGLEIGQRAGARLEAGGNEWGGLWSPVSETTRSDGSPGLYPHILLDRAKPGVIAVNKAGRRFVNEADSYHDFVAGMYRANATASSIPAWLVCDAAFVRSYGLGDIHPETRNLSRFERAGYITCADDLNSLAAKLGIDADGLADTVARHNRFAAEGRDPDFGKGDSELNLFNGDPVHGPNPCLGPVATPPFVALRIWPAEIACSTGLGTDENAQVIDGDGRPIAGLYACGNDMDSIMVGSYPGPGTTLGPAVVFAWRAATHAAKYG